MGLDMYLNGERFLFTNWSNPELDKKIDGFRLKKEILELGYWRKHPNLHGFIVENFAEGKDKCQEIQLSIVDLTTILKAIQEDKLPHTEGFFFGTSREEDKAPSIEIIKNAINWLSSEEKGIVKSVYYQASW